MQIVIEIPESVKQAFDNAAEDDIYGCYYDYNSIIGRAIKNGVPLETKQKMGRWINDREVVDKSRKPTTYHFDTHCSECGFKYAYTTDKKDSIPTNYCPDCGAKMFEPQESED